VEGHVSGVGDMSVGVGDVLVREGRYWWGGDMLGGEHQSVKHIKIKKYSGRT